MRGRGLAARRAVRRSARYRRLLQRAGFALPVTDVDRVTVRYAAPFALMHDLRRMGATDSPGRASADADAAAPPCCGSPRSMRERFAEPDGRIRATFDIIWLPAGRRMKPAEAAEAGLGEGEPGGGGDAEEPGADR